MGCEIFGWAMAPYFAVAVGVSYMFGSPVGMYGDGVDRLIRTRWGDNLWKTMRERMEDEKAADAPDPGVVELAENAVQAARMTLTSPGAAVPPEGTEATTPPEQPPR